MVIKKLKNIERVLRELNKKQFWCILEEVKEAQFYLEKVQSRLANDQSNEDLYEKEKLLSEKIRKLSWAKKSLAKQKSMVQWFKEGDKNTSYFSKYIKGRRNRNVINKIFLEDGTYTNNNGMFKEAFISHFKNVLNSPTLGIANKEFVE